MNPWRLVQRATESVIGRFITISQWEMDRLIYLAWPSGCNRTEYRAPAAVPSATKPDLSFAELPPPAPDSPNARHVDVQHPNAKDAGTHGINQPWKTLGYAAKHLEAGQAAYIHPGEYKERVRPTFPGQRLGSIVRPIWLLAKPGATLRDPGQNSQPFLRLDRPYWIVDGFKIDGSKTTGQGVRIENTSNVVVRQLDISKVTANAAVVLVGATHCSVSQSHIHENVNVVPEECHGVLVYYNCDQVVINNNNSWGNSGDSIQVQGPHDTAMSGAPSDARVPRNVTIEGNTYHEDVENAVDIKSSDVVTVRGNRCYGYRPGGKRSPVGDAIVAHVNADNVLIEGNQIHECGRAATIGAQIGQMGAVTLRWNVVYNMTSYSNNPDTASGFRVGPAKRVEIYHNTFHNLGVTPAPPVGQQSGYAIQLASADSAVGLASVLNNIYSDVGLAMRIGAAYLGKLFSDRNLHHNDSNNATGLPLEINGQPSSWATWQQRGYDCTSAAANPKFRDPGVGDFFTDLNSPARDKAIFLRIPDFLTYSCGSGTDLGAVESCP